MFKRVLVFLLLSFVTCLVFASSHVENYTFDPDHTYVQWSVSHFGFSDITGKFIVEGDLKFDPKNPEKSQVTVTIRIDSIATGIKELDERLKRTSFFDVKQFPTATFVVKKIIKTGKDTAKIDGVLTVRDVSKPVVLNVKLNKTAKHPFYKRKAMGFTATTELKRSDFGLRAYLPGVGDDVKIAINAEVLLKKPAAE